ncbi:lactonase family protein [Roseobacter weihaiensis]|uniref:lactonase family protein n=1 Tax=Roseobacter weihaiensis TaxID=2763262 RepID=UPI001D0B3377|nr:lactonase family protein [Roseobacter sp. H9]
MPLHPARAFLAGLSASLIVPGTSLAQDIPFADSDLIALSDGAMLATGYIDGLLGPLTPDLLSIVSRSDENTWTRADVEASNSVATWPNVMAVVQDGSVAIVSEPFAQPDEKALEFSEIEQGSTLSLVDLSDSTAPVVRQTVTTSSAPAAIDIHPSGELVAVTFPFNGEIGLYPFDDGQLGEPTMQPLGLEGVSNTFVPEIKWHPSGDFAAITLGGANQVVFYRYADGILEPWGEPITTAPLPGRGQWTKDGAYFLTTVINITGDLAQLSYGQNTSLLTVIAFDDDDEPNSPPRRANDRSTTYESAPVQHAVVASVPSGMGYVENFAVSPDERYVVGLNMVASWLPRDDPGHTDYSELTLLTLDPETGLAEYRSTTRMPGVVLPQGIVFDREGRHIAVTSYQDVDGGPGHLALWAFDPESSTPFISVGEPIGMPRGVHFLQRVDQ